jgi:hypothetical protein
MALLAPDIPFSYLFGGEVIVDGVTAVAERPSGTLHLFSGIVSGPPVGSVLCIVSAPYFVGNIPLRGEYEIVVADLCEVALLPFAAVDERDIVLFECDQRIGFGEVPDNHFRVHFGIDHHIRHARLLPPFERRRMTGGAGL